MSLLLITKRGTQKKLVDEEINYNWAGNEFKNFQEETKTKILFKRKILFGKPVKFLVLEALCLFQNI